MPVNVTVTIPDSETEEAKLAGMAYTNLPVTATPKELLAAVYNRVMFEWRQQYRPPSKGTLT